MGFFIGVICQKRFWGHCHRGEEYFALILQIIFPFLRDWKYIDSFETLGELEDFIKTRGFDKKKRK